MLLIQTISETLRPVVSNDWVVYVLLLNILIMTICKYVFPKNTYALRSLSEYININENQGVFTLISLLLLSALLGSLLVSTIDLKILLNTRSNKILLFSIFLLLFVFVKSCLSFLFYYAFNKTNKYAKSIRVATFFRCYLVFLLWLMVVLFYFSPIPKEVILIVVIVAVIITRIFQLYFYRKTQNIDLEERTYYNILYLCALEILPLLVIIKFLTS